MRIDSTNMDPLPFWAVGVQMVGLNFQRPETTPMQLNTALFATNGGCGYVLQEAVLAPPEAAPPAPQFLELSVVAAQHAASSRRASWAPRGRSPRLWYHRSDAKRFARGAAKRS